LIRDRGLGQKILLGLLKELLWVYRGDVAIVVGPLGGIKIKARKI